MTGGFWKYDVLATKYNLNGWMEDLPALNIGRQNHACAWLRDDGGTLVYLVTGGWQRTDQQPISSTEMLSSGSSQWTLTSPLPYSISGLRAVTLDNIPFLFGKIRSLFYHLTFNSKVERSEMEMNGNLCQTFINWSCKLGSGSNLTSP